VGTEAGGNTTARALSGAERAKVQQHFFKVLVHATMEIVSDRSDRSIEKNHQDEQAERSVHQDASNVYSAIVQFHRQLATFSYVSKLRADHLIHFIILESK
jgi:hypothetical protein